jgi:multidrug efflux pump subunit AcrA (membrane-fusion protein)
LFCIRLISRIKRTALFDFPVIILHIYQTKMFETMKEISGIFLFLTASLILVSCASKNNDPAPRPGGGGRPAGMTVSGVIVTNQPLDNVVNSSGTVLASESVDLAAEASGTVQAILFKE